VCVCVCVRERERERERERACVYVCVYFRRGLVVTRERERKGVRACMRVCNLGKAVGDAGFRRQDNVRARTYR
jgi:hypothetical protein